MFQFITSAQTNFQVVPLLLLVILLHMQPVDFHLRPPNDLMLPVAAATQCKLFTKTEI